LASISIIAAEDKPPCYEQWTCTNGKEVGPVVDEQSCLEACFACEGGNWRCKGYKSADGVVGAGNSTNTTTYHFCQCGLPDQNSVCNTWRDICVDPGYYEAAAADRTGVPSLLAALLLCGALVSELF